MLTHYQKTKRSSLDLPMVTPRTTYHPLSKVSHWHEYLTKVSDKAYTGLISPDLDALAPRYQVYASALQASTKKLSRMLTIVAALEAVFPDSLATKESLTLHLIGAEDEEFRSLAAFEELLHLLPALRSLHCVLAGPELGQPVDKNNELITFGCCPVCTDANRTRSAATFQGVYHDLAHSAAYEKPDLAVAFHTGSSQDQVGQWLPTLRHLVGAGHPTVFTSYNLGEMEEETELLAKGLGAQLLVPGQKNKWRCMVPRLEIMEEVENQLFYENWYWYMISGEKVGGSEAVVEKFMARWRVEEAIKHGLRHM